MESKLYFQNSKGDKLCGILNNPTGDLNKSIIILVHGHSSNKNSKNLVRLKDILALKHISTFRIDLHGHGESEGKFEETTVSEAVDDILQAVEFLKKQGYKKIGLFGSSFGGLSSIITASKTNNLILLALKSPVSNYEDKYKHLNGEKFIEDWKVNGERNYDAGEGRILKLQYIFYEDAIKNDGYKAAPNIKIPTIIVHGDTDEQVPLEQSLKISQLIPNCKLVIILGSDHVYTKPEHSQQMLNAFSEFIFQNSL